MNAAWPSTIAWFESLTKQAALQPGHLLTPAIHAPVAEQVVLAAQVYRQLVVEGSEQVVPRLG